MQLNRILGRISPACFCLILLLCPAFSAASSLNLEVANDDTGNNEAHLDLAFDTPGGGSVYGSYGQSKLSDTVNLDTTQYSLGIETDMLAKVGVGVGASYWGQSGSLEIISRELNLYINPVDWALSISPRMRNIFIYTTGLATKFKESVDVRSRGVEFSADYYGAMPWTIGASWLSNDFDKNVSALADDPRLLLLLSPSTLMLASGFELHRTTLRLGYDFNWGSAELEGSRSHSAVDSSNADYRSITLYWPKDKDWQLYLGYGKLYLNNSSSETALTRAGLTWNW